MSKSRRPSKKQIREFLLESVFDPRESGTPLSVVVGFNDPDYCEMKALELTHEAVKQIKEWPEAIATAEIHRDKITQAISLLTLARAQRETTQA